MDRANSMDKRAEGQRKKRRAVAGEQSASPRQVVTKRNFMTLRQQKTRGCDDGMASVTKSQAEDTTAADEPLVPTPRASYDSTLPQGKQVCNLPPYTAHGFFLTLETRGGDWRATTKPYEILFCDKGTFFCPRRLMN